MLKGYLYRKIKKMEKICSLCGRRIGFLTKHKKLYGKRYVCGDCLMREKEEYKKKENIDSKARIENEKKFRKILHKKLKEVNSKYGD